MAYINLTFEIEPVQQQRPRHTKFSSKPHDPVQTRNFKSLLKGMAAMAMIQKGYPKLSGPILYRVAFYRSIPKSWPKKKQKAAHELIEPVVTTPDTDNYVKSLSDSLNDIVWEDDRTVVGFSAIKAYSEQPRIVIEAWNPTHEDILSFIPRENADE